MVRSILLMLLINLVVPSNISAQKPSLIDEYLDASDKQKQFIQIVYDKGKEFGLEKTLVVAAWKESSFGIRLEDTTGEWSGGPFGASYYHTAIRHFNLLITEGYDENATLRLIPPTPTQLAYVENRLKTDLDFAIKHAVIHFREGIDKFGNENMDLMTTEDWLKVWAFNNGGYEYWDTSEAKAYAEDFLKKMKVFNKVGILR